MIALPVRRLLSDTRYHLQLELLAGRKGLDKKKIIIPHIQKPGLALTGETSNLHPGRVQVLGNPEMKFLLKTKPAELETLFQKLCHLDLACFVITDARKPPAIFVKQAERAGIPLLTTALSSAIFIVRISKFLEENLTETTTAHGVLVDVFGVGILLTGKSGMGKSECGLELVMKGHRLVADDIVHIQKRAPNELYGSASDLLRYHMEIRGLGIINIKDLFGVASVRDQKLIEMVIDMIEWTPREEYERLGVDEKTREMLGVRLPLIRIPVRPGRSLTSVIEVAARNQLLKQKGIYSAHEFQEKLAKAILAGGKKGGLPEGWKK
ncbi:MAG: HPr(Ser) kinase/phosphatase [Deltaproteobacteria bacterium]|nr:HPr(Ser) kinase/phosphatase [Deltaproteobacteria bacterium]